MRVYGGWIKRYCDLCSKHIPHRTVCYNSPLVRDKPLGVPAFVKIIYCPRQGSIIVSFYSLNGLDVVILMKSVAICICTWSCFTTSGHERTGRRFEDDIFKSRLSRNTFTFKRAIRVLNINRYPCTHYFQISSKRFIWVIMVQPTVGQVSDIGFIAVHGLKKVISMA